MNKRKWIERSVEVGALGISLVSLIHHRLKHKKWTDGLTACHGLAGLVVSTALGK